MKTKVFKFKINKDLVILATARIINVKCYVSYCYAESQKEVEAKDIAKINNTIIINWAIKNNGILWSY